jgi:site-specific DNA-methyltransferase (adenine-specific)
MIEVNKIYCEDAISFLAKLDCKVFIITDVPYGIKESNKKNLSRRNLALPTDYGNYEWDQKKLDKIYIDLMIEKSYNQIIFGGQNYANWLEPNYGWIVWDKNNGNNDFSDCELAYTNFLNGIRKFKWRWNGMFQENMKEKEKRWHPTQKPLSVMRWIIKNFTTENDLICDPFCGSGTTAVACIVENRNYICSDNVAKYVEITNMRINYEESKLKLPLVA